MSVALDIYTTMQRNGVEADKKFYAALMAVAAKVWGREMHTYESSGSGLLFLSSSSSL
jgi:hypothetical protein